ncbi:MAG: ATP-binding protein [Erysipelotrichaceae bacterium]|nr:ATP-binding protein [Erysipelotrichaceae bacterium]MDY5252335.1 ATP-binding protein [Erysipelotrichaceae bacterium]
MKIKLATRIGLCTVVLIFIAVLISIFISGKWYIDQMMVNIEENTLNVVKIASHSRVIIEGLQKDIDDGSIQTYVNNIQNNIENIDVMVVADTDGKRYGHTKSDRVGLMFSANDNAPALLEGKTYVSIGPGTLGDSLRAFAPIKADDGHIIGFVMAGTLLDSIAKAERTIFIMAIIFTFISGGIGIVGAMLLARYIKRKLLNYEPEDIAHLYLENVTILKTIKEGVIEIDRDHKIINMNKTAEEFLNMKDWYQKDIRLVCPNSKLTQVIDEKQAIYDYQCYLADKLVLTNNVPIETSAGKIIGAVCSFRDQREINQLANEITGVKRIVDALRATTHEFKNKLHVILGLIETNRLDQAKAYIGAINDELQATITDIMNHIQEPTIAALLIGKVQRMNETKISWELDDASNMEDANGFDVNDLVTIIGNILDNAIDELNSIDKTSKHIKALLILNDRQLYIKICDNGSGIKAINKIFIKGYTTKQGSRGYGLYLLKQLVDKYHGTIDIMQTKDEGTCFLIKMKGIYHD